MASSSWVSPPSRPSSLPVYCSGPRSGIVVPVADHRRKDPTKAVEHIETFISGCYEKAEEIDDSGGSFGMFVEDLFCTWIKARQAAKADAHKTVRQLLEWKSDDDYGFCHEIERDAVKAFNRAVLRAFAEIARDEWTKKLAEVEVREKGDKMTR